MVDDIWDEILRGDQILRHEFDMRYSNVVEDLKAARGGHASLLVYAGNNLVPDDERAEIATTIWNDLILERGNPLEDITYEDILLGQEIYRKLMED